MVALGWSGVPFGIFLGMAVAMVRECVFRTYPLSRAVAPNLELVPTLNKFVTATSVWSGPTMSPNKQGSKADS